MGSEAYIGRATKTLPTTTRSPGAPGVAAYLEEKKSEQYISLIVQSAVLPAITHEQVANASGVDPELSELRKYIHRSAIHLPRELAHYRSFINELSVTKESSLETLAS